MNVPQSILAAPNTSSSREGKELTQPLLDARSGDGTTTKPNNNHTSAAREDEVATGLANVTSPTFEPVKPSSHLRWSAYRRAELRLDHEPSASAGKKRTSSKISPLLSTASGPPPSKKLLRRHRYRAELPSLHSTRRLLDDPSPSEPLFFSHQTRQRPPLPYRLSSSEAGARMLSKASKDDSGGVKTLKLARGSMSSPSRPSGQRTPSGSGRNYLGLLGKSKSPDNGVKSENAFSTLHQVGVVELLEQDERPTFILDLNDQVNFGPGPLKVIFANTALRAVPGMLDTVTGIANQGSPNRTLTTAFSDFKAWCVSYVKDHEALDVSLPFFSYAGATWTSCTLRKRFRVFKGAPMTPRPNLGSHPASLGFPSTSSVGKENELPTDSRSDKIEATEEEAQDYFGRADSTVSAKSPRTVNTGHSIYKDSADVRVDQAPKMAILTEPLGFKSQGAPISGLIPTSPPGLRNNEVILQAATAGDVDPFSMFPNAEPGFFDWTRLPISPTLPSHIRFARSVDWASTPLGPIEDWPTELRSMCNLIMASPHPAAMYWGDDFIAIYNEAYIHLAGQKHPQLMGQSYKVAWAEIWDNVKDVFENAKTTGQATMKDDDCLFIQRSAADGYLEETYFSWSIIPLVGGDGSVVGLYNPAFEKTKRRVAERRMLTLRELGEKTATARDLKTFWEEVLVGLQYNEHDAPFVLLYSVIDEVDSDSQSSVHSNGLMGNKLCILEGSLGIPEGHPAAAPHLDLRDGSEYFAQVFREASKGDRPAFLSVEDGTLDAGLLEGIEWRGFGDRCIAAVCCPIHLTGNDTTLGFLVMGVNPRRPYDDDYSLYVQLLSRQIATAMASVVLFEEEIARGRRAARIAALDRIMLSEQLAARTQEAVQAETKFTRMATFAPVGIFIADSEGKITYCNEKWWEISKIPKGPDGTDKWMDFIRDEDKEQVLKLWSDLVQNAVPLNTELRFKSSWVDQNGNKGDKWVLASAFPEKNEDGNVKVIFGSITDISQQKWAEYFEKRRMEEAVELKRQQENFIDITSHEMRNPLSAILQCADEISTTMTDLLASDFPPEVTEVLTRNAVEASGTIALCAQHQKRIVDDVLTLSKLDSALLLVTPCDVMPKTVVHQALKMFDGEVQTAGIQLNLKIDESIEKLGVQWVKLDPSRLLQVLINLTTNAIKFTTSQEKKVINVTFAASLDRPSKDGVVSFFPTRSKRKDLTKSADWGTGQKIFIHFAVEDTGRGLTDDEKKLLFLRFSQASPRTHVQYGGSGLGLFISRELVELQGGEIGVASKAGEGSTFAFYVKARRTTAPTDGADQYPAAIHRKGFTGKHLMPISLKAPAQSSQPASLSNNSSPQRIDTESDLKILIVEDNLVNQKVLGKQLRNMGCTVHVANHGGECLDRLKESTFWKGNERSGLVISVILMDQEMPVMDGLICTREIRNMEKRGDVTRHVPIIAITANARNEQIDTAMGAGMDDVVSKPFRIVDLIPKVEELIAKFPAPT